MNALAAAASSASTTSSSSPPTTAPARVLATSQQAPGGRDWRSRYSPCPVDASLPLQASVPRRPRGSSKRSYASVRAGTRNRGEAAVRWRLSRRLALGESDSARLPRRWEEKRSRVTTRA
jgi:hypothetical protein